MPLAVTPIQSGTDHLESLELMLAYKKTRALTVSICSWLEAEDAQVQSMPEVSPPKWHLAHTTWFFECFVLKRLIPDYQEFHPGFHYLFNSYYEGLGPHHERSGRGLLTRPLLREVMQYRDWVDTRICQTLSAELECGAELRRALILGKHHEQQHQELLLTDIKHVFWSNPMKPAYLPRPAERGGSSVITGADDFMEFPGGLRWIGHEGETFAFDNESPTHRAYLEPYRLARGLVTNGQYLEFIRAGGYREPRWWLSDGWAAARQLGWEAPLYWEKNGPAWRIFTLAGLQDLCEDEPVCHLSYYEADAFARWRGARLPTEAEWEAAVRHQGVGACELADANFLESERWHPAAAGCGRGLRQCLGDVWEWTSSSYGPYPGFRPFPGSFAEYNGKFMTNQMVLRGGSCATPRTHIRETYRNFFSPSARWQFSGVRLAQS